MPTLQSPTPSCGPSHPRNQPFALVAALDSYLPDRNGLMTDDGLRSQWRDVAKQPNHILRQQLRSLHEGSSSSSTNAPRQRLREMATNEGPAVATTTVGGGGSCSLIRPHGGCAFLQAHRPVPGEWYPTERSLTAVEIQFCEAWHLHPRLYLEAKLELLLRPERPYFALLDVAVLVSTVFAEDTVNVPLAEALIAFFAAQRMCEEVDLIERLPPPPRSLQQ